MTSDNLSKILEEESPSRDQTWSSKSLVSMEKVSIKRHQTNFKRSQGASRRQEPQRSSDLSLPFKGAPKKLISLCKRCKSPQRRLALILSQIPNLDCPNLRRYAARLQSPTRQSFYVTQNFDHDTKSHCHPTKWWHPRAFFFLPPITHGVRTCLPKPRLIFGWVINPTIN